MTSVATDDQDGIVAVAVDNEMGVVVSRKIADAFLCLISDALTGAVTGATAAGPANIFGGRPGRAAGSMTPTPSLRNTLQFVRSLSTTAAHDGCFPGQLCTTRFGAPR
jgi:hypothetical protein